MLNLLHELSSGPEVPEVVNAVVEIAKGSRNKYEYSKTAGVMKLDRVLYSAVFYPTDYGFIPRTLTDDGDPLDILVLMNYPTFPGCVIEARPIGMFKMVDKGELDYKVLAVPNDDPYFKDFHSLEDVPAHLIKEIEHFFMTYKDLQGTKVAHEGWVDAAQAKETILESRQTYLTANNASGDGVQA